MEQEKKVPQKRIYQAPLSSVALCNPFDPKAYGFDQLSALYHPNSKPPISQPRTFLRNVQSMLKNDPNIAKITPDYIAFQWYPGGKGKDIKPTKLDRKNCLNILSCAAHHYNPLNPEQTIEIFTTNVNLIHELLAESVDWHEDSMRYSAIKPLPKVEAIPFRHNYRHGIFSRSKPQPRSPYGSEYSPSSSVSELPVPLVSVSSPNDEQNNDVTNTMPERISRNFLRADSHYTASNYANSITTEDSWTPRDAEMSSYDDRVIFTKTELVNAMKHIKVTHLHDLFKENWPDFTQKEKQFLENCIMSNSDARSLTNTPASMAGDMKFVIGYRRLSERKSGVHIFDVDTEWNGKLPEMQAPLGILTNRSYYEEDDLLSLGSGSKISNTSNLRGCLENQAISLPYGSKFPQEILKKLIYCYRRIEKGLTAEDTLAQEEAEYFLPSKKHMTYEKQSDSFNSQSSVLDPLDRTLYLKFDSTRVAPHGKGTGYKFEFMNYKDIKVIADTLREFGFGDDEGVKQFSYYLSQPNAAFYIPDTVGNWGNKMSGERPASAPPDCLYEEKSAAPRQTAQASRKTPASRDRYVGTSPPPNKIPQHFGSGR